VPYLESLTKSAPANSAVLYNLGSSYSERGQYDEATRPDAGHFASAWLLRHAAHIQRTGRSAVHRLLGWQQAA
jgi:hypothetical protein